MGKRVSKSKRGSVKREKTESEEESKIKEEDGDEKEEEEENEPEEPPTGKRKSKSKRGSVKREKKALKEQSKIKEEGDEKEEEKIEAKEPAMEKKKSKAKRGSVKREKKARKEESKIKEEECDEEEKEKNEPEEPTDEALRAHIRRLIPLVNLQNTGVKAFTKLLSKECGGADLKPRMKFIKTALSEAINALDDDESEENEPKKPRKTGLSVKKEISTELAGFLGRGPTELVARTDVVKGMWDYIKANELQNPDNKREIFLDEKMKNVFGCDTFTMFTMNKYLGAHIHPFKPVDLTTNTAKKKKQGTPGRKRKKRGGDDSDNDSGDDRGKKKRKPKKPGLQPPYRLSKELADLVGTNILPRPQVVKGIWAHIKKHDLQNPKDKREILCDGKLKKVMGGEDKVTMFNMNRYVTDHLLEKLDRSEYNHDETEAELQARDEELES
jgi:upstream activation factor subunit UAF30